MRQTQKFRAGEIIRFRDARGRERIGEIRAVTPCTLIGRPDLLAVTSDDEIERVICASRAEKYREAARD